MRAGAAWPSTSASGSCPTAGGTYETQPVSGERSVKSAVIHAKSDNLIMP